MVVSLLYCAPGYYRSNRGYRVLRFRPTELVLALCICVPQNKRLVPDHRNLGFDLFRNGVPEDSRHDVTTSTAALPAAFYRSPMKLLIHLIVKRRNY
jgi:hypothetical protein